MSFKVRQQFLVTGDAQFGSSGCTVTNLIFGSACINCPSSASLATVVAASVAVANVANGDNLWIQPMGNAPSGMLLAGACAIAGGISASWYNSASADQSASADVPVNYLVLN